MKQKKIRLNIGSGDAGFNSHINIDNDLNIINQTTKEKYVICDGNKLPFKNESVDEIFSNQCIGEYVTNYDEILRVLKVGGKVILGVWEENIGMVLGNLIFRDVRITKVDWMNGVLNEKDFTLKIIGIKTL